MAIFLHVYIDLKGEPVSLVCALALEGAVFTAWICSHRELSGRVADLLEVEIRNLAQAKGESKREGKKENRGGGI